MSVVVKPISQSDVRNFETRIFDEAETKTNTDADNRPDSTTIVPIG